MLHSVGLQRVGHSLATEHHQQEQNIIWTICTPRSVQFNFFFVLFSYVLFPKNYIVTSLIMLRDIPA